MRNLAYYRIGKKFPAGWRTEPLYPDAGFWRAVNANFIDQCVLDWCKLFGDLRGQHHWHKIVHDKTAFEAALLKRLRTSPPRFDKYRVEMNHYRDKFVAHLDSELIMQIPHLMRAKWSIEFYYEYLVGQEVQVSDLAGLPKTVSEFRRGYTRCRTEATRVYKAGQARRKRK
jgi:hypothetical protein